MGVRNFISWLTGSIFFGLSIPLNSQDQNCPPDRLTVPIQTLVQAVATIADNETQIKRNLADLENVVRRAYRAEKIRQRKSLLFLDREKTLRAFREKSPNSEVTLSDVENALHSEVEEWILIKMFPLLLANLAITPNGLGDLEVKRPNQLLSLSDQDYIREKFSKKAVTINDRTPVLILKNLRRGNEDEAQDVGGLQFSFDDFGKIDIGETAIPIERNSMDRKISIFVFIDPKAWAPLISQIFKLIFQSDSLILLEEQYVEPKSDRIAEIARRWALLEEIFHNLLDTDARLTTESTWRSQENQYLEASAHHQKKNWLERDTTHVLKHPQLTNYLQWLQWEDIKDRAEESRVNTKEIKPQTFEEIRAQIPEILAEDYPRDYEKFWPYLASASELEAKWRVAQFLKHQERVSLYEILQAQVYLKRPKREGFKEDPKALHEAKNIFFVLEAPTIQSYYRLLYESDHKSPLFQINPFAKTLFEIRQEQLQGPERIKQELEKRLKFKFQ